MTDEVPDDVLVLVDTLDAIEERTRGIERSASAFAAAMTRAFAQSVTAGRSFDETLKSLFLRLSGLAVQAAFKPLESGLASLFGGLFGGDAAGAPAGDRGVKAFATGGVIGAPTYFPLDGGGLGLMGEAGPEAIMPLSRGADGRLGVASAPSRAATQINVHIATPDADSFRRSEAYLAGQIARTVARGQRSL